LKQATSEHLLQALIKARRIKYGRAASQSLAVRTTHISGTSLTVRVKSAASSTAGTIPQDF